MLGRSIFIEEILNFTGGTFRWIVGTCYSKITNKESFTFLEYINGPKKKNYYDRFGHNLNNRIIGILIIIFIMVPIVKLFLK